MMKDYDVIKFNDLAVMPWRNGQGKTRQLDIYPINSTLSHLDFDYRISMAEITGPNEFSRFPGLRRYLTVVRGQGIKLNELELLTNKIINFSGDEKINSQLINSTEPVLDLGIMYNPRKAQVSFEILESKNLLDILNPTYDIAYLVLLKGQIVCSGDVLCELDTLKFSKPKFKLSSDNCKFCFIKIKNLI